MLKSVLCCFALLASIQLKAGEISLREAWERAAEKDLRLAIQKADIRSSQMSAHIVREWEDPVVDYAVGTRTSSIGPGSNQNVAVRQRLPFWTSTSRQSEAIAKMNLAKETEFKSSRAAREGNFVRLIYRMQVSGIALKHLTERLRRVRLIREHLRRTKAYSPTAEVERHLIESRLAELEVASDILSHEGLTLRHHVGVLSGISAQEQIEVRWALPASLDRIETQITAEFKNVRLGLVASDFELEARKATAKALEPRPSFEIFASRFRQMGGDSEQGGAIGLGLTIPIWSYFSDKRQQARIEISAAEARRELETQTEALQQMDWKASFSSVASEIRHYPTQQMNDWDAIVDRAERELRRGLVSVIQFLELETKMHEKIERAFHAQERLVQIFSEVCETRGCSTTSLLGAW